MFQNTAQSVIEQHQPDSLIFLNNRVDHNQKVIAEYRELLRDGFELDPVSAVRDETGQIYVWDGRLRGEAAKQAALQLPVRSTPGTRLDAEWLAASANQKHGLRRTNRDKRHAVKLALLHPYGAEQSNRSLGRHCGVDAKTVASVRQELEAVGGIPVITNRRAERGNGQVYSINTQPIGTTTADAVNRRLPEAADDANSLEQAVRFAADETWNAVPTKKCLGELMDFNHLREAISAEELDSTPGPDGRVPEFCPQLRLFPQHIEQIIPITDANQPERLLDRIDSFCVDPQANQPDSCFNQQEQAAMQAAVAAFQTAGLPAVLPDAMKARKKSGGFIWLEPQLNGAACTPETCHYANDDPPGYAVIPQPGGKYQMACLHAGCGGEAQQALVDHEAEQRREAERQRQEAINKLRQATVEKTFFGDVDLSCPEVMETLESILVPEWDTATMEHVVIGWQRAMATQLATELEMTEVQPEFEARYELLANAPTANTIRHQFALLREQIVLTEHDWSRWLTCLTLVRGWRDEIGTVEAVEEAMEQISAFHPLPAAASQAATQKEIAALSAATGWTD